MSIIIINIIDMFTNCNQIITGEKIQGIADVFISTNPAISSWFLTIFLYEHISQKINFVLDFLFSISIIFY